MKRTKASVEQKHAEEQIKFSFQESASRYHNNDDSDVVTTHTARETEEGLLCKEDERVTEIEEK